MLSIIILIILLLFGFAGYKKGVSNESFSFEIFLLTLLLFPFTYDLFLNLSFFINLPYLVQKIIGIFLFLFAYIILKIIVQKIVVFAGHAKSAKDKSCGFVAGISRGFLLFFILITIYATAFLDNFLPQNITDMVKTNFENKIVEKSVEAYRSFGYLIYSKVKSSKITDLYRGSEKAKEELYGKQKKVNLPGYKPWIVYKL